MVDYNNLHREGFAARKRGAGIDQNPVDRRTHANGYVQWKAGWHQANNICANLPTVSLECTPSTTDDTYYRHYQQAATERIRQAIDNGNKFTTLTLPHNIGR